jgi:hypothetical protein
VAFRLAGCLLGIGMIEIGRIAYQEIPLLAAGRKILKGAVVKVQMGKGGIRSAIGQGFGMTGGVHLYPGYLGFRVALCQHKCQQAATAAHVQDTLGTLLLRPGAQQQAIGTDALRAAVVVQAEVAEVEGLHSSSSPSGNAAK